MAFAGASLIIFALLAAALSQMLENFFVNQTVNSLISQGREIAESYARAEIAPTPWHRESALNQVREDMLTIHNLLGASSFILNAEGLIFARTTDLAAISPGEQITDPTLLAVFAGDTIVLRADGGIFGQSVVSVGYPVFLGGEAIGAIFMNAPMADILRTNAAAMRLILISLLVTLVLTFILVYFTSRTISRPIKTIGDAAAQVAAGDFARRLDIRGPAEIGQLAASFNNMAASLSAFEDGRRRFIADISHDLRTPLTSMGGFLTAMLDGTIPEENRERYLKIVLAETHRLTDLANDILDISKMNTTPQLRIEDFDILDKINQTCAAFDAAISAKNIEQILDLGDLPIIVRADSSMIGRVLHNLLDNAVKFTPDGGKISISLRPEAEKVHISISDTGIGISETDHPHIFNRFYKADSSRGKQPGSGLGLAIVHDILKAHNQNITLASTPGKGSEFSFSLKTKLV